MRADRAAGSTLLESDDREHILGMVADFKKRRRRQLIASVPMFILLVLVLLAEDPQRADRLGLPPVVIFPAFFAYVIGMLAFSWFNWRCPSCRRYLGKGISPKFCTRCGAQLQL